MCSNVIWERSLNGWTWFFLQLLKQTWQKTYILIYINVQEFNIWKNYNEDHDASVSAKQSAFVSLVTMSQCQETRHENDGDICQHCYAPPQSSPGVCSW
jgi:hypothetical protein